MRSIMEFRNSGRLVADVDVAVYGGGPAGISAAVASARRSLARTED